MPRREFTVHARWDDEAQVWYVEDSDVPGLAVEGATVEELRSKLLDLIPELVSLNRHLIDGDPDGDISVHIMAERLEKMRAKTNFPVDSAINPATPRTRR